MNKRREIELQDAIDNVRSALIDSRSSLDAAMKGDFLCGTQYRDNNGLECLNPSPDAPIGHVENAISTIQAALSALPDTGEEA